MGPHRHSILAALLALAILVPALAGVAAASPAPGSVCGPCDRAFESAARANDIEVSVERSTATVRVHANGSATWTVENRLSGAGLETLRGNDDRLDRVAAEALDVRAVSKRGHTFREATMVEGDTARLRYVTPDFAESTVGVLRSDYFRDDPGVLRLVNLGADRLTVVAPEGMTVARGVPDAEVDGRRMTLRSFDSSGDGPFVVFAPAGSALAGGRAAVAATAPLVPVVLGNLLWLVTLPAALLAALVAGVSRLTATASPSADVDRVHWVAALTIGVAVLLPWLAGRTVVGSIPLGSMVTIWGVGSIVIAAVSAARPHEFGLRRQLVTIVAGIALGVAVGAAVGHVGTRPLGRLFPAVVVPATALLGLPLGTAAARGDASLRRRVLAVQVGLFALGVAVTRDLTASGGTLFGLGVVLLAVAAVVTVLLSLPLVALGATLPVGGVGGGRSEH